MTAIAPHSVVTRPFLPGIVFAVTGSWGFLSTTDLRCRGLMCHVRQLAGVGDQMSAATVRRRSRCDQFPIHLANFTSLSRVRSERPTCDLHHSYLVDRLRTEGHPAAAGSRCRATGSSPHLAIGTASRDLGVGPT